MIRAYLPVHASMKIALHVCILLAAVCGTAAFADTVKYAYDDAGRLIHVAYPNGKAITYVYDKAGNLLSRAVTLGVAPVITGVVNGASFLPGIAAATWITIQGTGLSVTTRGWGGSDFVNGDLPVELDSVSVKVNGIAAYVN